LLRDADFLIVLGSDDPRYTASKIFPYILAGKPILALFHESSSAASVLRETGAGSVLCFTEDSATEEIGERVFVAWRDLLPKLPFTQPIDWNAFAPYTAAEMTRRQAELFDRVLAATRS
jgi:hypothetical protein